MIAHCLEGLPEEACGLLVGDYATGITERLVPVENVAHSALVYTVDPKAHMLADRAAAAEGLDIIGVFHSHTHTETKHRPLADNERQYNSSGFAKHRRQKERPHRPRAPQCLRQHRGQRKGHPDQFFKS